ncbi:phytochrome-like protein [Hysterangium stoloniferum]|nr:phytochrome-like protein [Hysterangium stoloniferum]
MTDSNPASESESTQSSLASAGLVHLAPISPDSRGAGIHLLTPREYGGRQKENDEGSHLLQSDQMNTSRVSVQGSSSPPASSTGCSNDLEPTDSLTTYRFEHVQSGDGEHHVIVGREGNLTRCEDEPIRVPGAVQGFGVLIALQEVDNFLVVRQVSENAYKLLGLSPQYLFSMDCFTQTLSGSQADVLWDTVHSLNDLEVEDSKTTEGPQVFFLSGWGEPGSMVGNSGPTNPAVRRFWACWCAAHRSSSGPIVLEFELECDIYNPLYPQSSLERPDGSSRKSGDASKQDFSTLGDVSEDRASVHTPGIDRESISPRGLQGDENWYHQPEDILESTTSYSKPLRALERMRRMTATSETETKGDRRERARAARGIGTLDVFSVLSQVNDQLATAPDLDIFLKIVVGVIKDLCQFHRVLIYQFDEMWNGQVVAELVDWNQTQDLYRNLHFPAADIPAQARELYTINKVRLLYSRTKPTARLVVRSKSDLDTPLDLTHSYLRALSPIHLKYLGNMGVRASMSISIVAFGALWGLIACHSYGDYGMRVSFPVRQMLRLLSDSISRNVERLSYTQRLHTRKLINTLPIESHPTPTSYIVSNAEDLLSLFDADYGVLVVGEGAKILGPNQHGREILILAEYLRLKQFEMVQVSQAVTVDYPDLVLPTGLEVIAGLLYVPLSSGGKDFIALLRKGQLRDVHWAGRPYKDGDGQKAVLEPRKSFKMWSEKIIGRCRMWTEEQLETAGVLALVYGKFIEIWRQETALQTTQLTSLLLSNASHEVRTPLNHIINYLELALNGPLDGETRENLTRSHAASKSLLFTINDLLDLTKLESGGETAFNEPFDLHANVDEATCPYRAEAGRKGIKFDVNTTDSPPFVIGDAKKVRTVLGNLVANAVKYTTAGRVYLECRNFPEPVGLRTSQQTVVEFVVTDTGCGMTEAKLESMFREFQQVESKTNTSPGLGLGLALVARIIEQLGGQLRVESKPNEGSRFSFLIPFGLCDSFLGRTDSINASMTSRSPRFTPSSISQTDGKVDALAPSQMATTPFTPRVPLPKPQDGVECANVPLRAAKVDSIDSNKVTPNVDKPGPNKLDTAPKMRVLVVDDDAINRTILSKRLTLDGQEVLRSTNGQEAVEMIQQDRSFDCVLMDIQMPILDGFGATKEIRKFEALHTLTLSPSTRTSLRLNGRIPIFAVSASLVESQRELMTSLGFDGWILKPIDFKRLRLILRGITDTSARQSCVYHPGYNWEVGGWLSGANVPKSMSEV